MVELDCANDAEAVARAETYADGRPMELWRRDRWIRRFFGAGRPSDISQEELPR